jgi:hypothetical protein
VTLRQESERVLRAALTRLPGGTIAIPARLALESALDQLSAPMRLAVVGRARAGKSTLVNAIVGADLLPAGTATTTPWVLRHDEAAGPPAHVQDADGGRRVELSGPFACLREFELIDTPGHGVGQPGSGVGQPGSGVGADAVIAVLNDAVTSADEEFVRNFHSDHAGFASTPITTIAVLTRTEELWPGEAGQPASDPLETAAQNARRIMSGSQTGRLFHNVLPVGSKIAAAAACFSAADHADLIALSKIRPATLESRLMNRGAFATRDYPDLPVRRERRAALADRFSQYGVALACRLVRDGAEDPRVLRQELERRSGLPALRAELRERFGGRQDLIKLGRIVDTVRRVRSEVPPGADSRQRAAVDDALQPVIDLEHTATITEFFLLRSYYTGQIDMPAAEADEFLRAAGELPPGLDDTERTALAALADMEGAALGRLSYWRRSPTADTPEGRAVVRVMERHYERLCARVRQARSILQDSE